MENLWEICGKFDNILWNGKILPGISRETEKNARKFWGNSLKIIEEILKLIETF